MEIRIQVIIDNDERTRRDIARWERTSLTSETLGLQLDEARALLQTSQEAMVSAQADVRRDQGSHTQFRARMDHRT